LIAFAHLALSHAENLRIVPAIGGYRLALRLQAADTGPVALQAELNDVSMPSCQLTLKPAGTSCRQDECAKSDAGLSRKAFVSVVVVIWIGDGAAAGSARSGRDPVSNLRREVDFLLRRPPMARSSA
jgi:hypothetical protein